MSDNTEMMLDGILCEECGVYIGEAVGYPRKCRCCAAEGEEGLFQEEEERDDNS